jgi:GNAT superfamily N-acetyltransferase
MADQGGIDDFVRGFRRRILAMRQDGQQLVDEPGIVALLGTSPQALDGRALVTSDDALEVLQEHLSGLSARVVNVFAAAQACHRLLSETGAYRLEPCTAMVHGDLGSIRALDLPDGLSLRPVSRASDPSEGVALEDAAAAALRSDPSASPVADLAGFVGYLRSVPNARYLAATDSEGVVRATAAAAVFGSTAGVFFVDTEHAWRGRGVGTAMTVAALRTAVEAGADNACLDASELGLSIYLRLGFTPVSATTLFVREG